MTKWLLAALAVVLSQVFILAALSDLYPLLSLIAVIIAVTRLRWNRSLTVALWIGLLLDSLSIHTFGLFMVIYLGVWAIARWLQQTGIVLSGLMGMVFAVLLLTSWQTFMILGAAALGGSGSGVLMLLPLFIGQSVVTLAFALPLRRLL